MRPISCLSLAGSLAGVLLLNVAPGLAQEPALHVEGPEAQAPDRAPSTLQPTVENGAICTTIDFEGIGNQSTVPDFEGISSPGWLGLIDADAGGTGNFAFEPSPETIAFWLGGAPGSRDIVIPDPVSRVEFFYASFPAVRMEAFDADGNLLDSAIGPGNFNQGPGGDPTGSFNQWDPLGVESDENNIVRVRVSGNVNQTGIDDLKVCRQLRIHSLEITQAIQEIQTIEDLTTDLEADREPPVLLIDDKDAVLRVYMQQVQTVVTVEVEVEIPGVLNESRRLTLQPHCDPETRRRREDGCRSMDFYFDAPGGDWTAGVRLLTDTGDELEAHDLPLRSRDTDRLVLRSVSVCDTQDPATGAWACGTAATLGGLTGLLGQTAPTHRVEVSASNNFVRNDINGYDDDGDGNLDSAERRRWFNETVAEVADLYGLWDRFLGVGQERYYYGMLRNEVPGGIGGIALRPGRGGMSRESTVRLGVEVNFETVAHEVGHMLGRPHTNTDVPQAVGGAPPGCYNLAENAGTDWPYADNTLQSDNGPEVGFSLTRRRPVLPESNFDWMGYCVPRWISPFTFNQAQPPLEALPVVQPVVGAFWTVGGVLEADGVSFRPLFEVETLGPGDAGLGSHAIEVRDAAGTVLAERRFDPRLSDVETTEAPQAAGPPTFFELVPVQAGAAAIVVVDPGGSDLGSLALGGADPAVEITFPGPGDLLSGVEELTWSISDPDSTEHWSAVDYSADGGQSWSRLGLVAGTTSLVVNFDAISGSEGPRLRVTVSDGVNSGVDLVEGFTVGRKLPTVTILTPENGEVFAPWELVQLRANAYDPDDGFLDGAAVEWTSSVEGRLGTGASLSTTALSEGEHFLNVDATDSDGNLASTGTTVRVAGPPPEIDLTVVKLDELPTTCVQVTLDARTGSFAVGLATIEYSLDGGAGWIPVALDALPFRFIVPGDGFFHLVARAFDEAGQVAAADDRFFIDSPCPNQPPVADAGPDQTVECASPAGTPVTLDGSGSFDPDGDPLIYEWRDADGNVVSTDAVVQVTLGLGTFPFRLTVDDGKGGVDSDTVEVIVRDTTPPAIESLTVSPDLLWPPNHKMVPVEITVVAVDLCDPAPVSQTVAVSSSEPVSGTGDETSPDWQLTGPLSVDLRAERLGTGDGRAYTIEVESSDASGNAARDTVQVLVPHDQGGG